MPYKRFFYPLTACHDWLHTNRAQILLSAIGVFILYFLEAQGVSLNAKVTMPFPPYTRVDLPPLIYLSIACGALAGGLVITTLDAGHPPHRLSAIWPTCGFLGAACYTCASYYPDYQTPLLLTSAFGVGSCLSRVVDVFFARTTLPQQALVLATAGAVGEWLTMASMSTRMGETHSTILACALLSMGILAGLLTAVPAENIKKNGIEPRSTRRALVLLCLFAVLFFALHSTHKETFHIDFSPHPNLQIWVTDLVRLSFPALGFVAYTFGLIPLSIFSMALSVFDPVVNSIPQHLPSYTFVRALDTISMQGGTIFITLAFMQLAAYLPRASLCRTLPYMLLNFIYGALWLVQSLVTISPADLHLLSVCIVAALMPVLAALRNAMFLPHADTLTSDTAVSIAKPRAREYRIPVQEFACSKGLSPRESEVFTLMVEGLSYADMAARLFISEATIKIHAGRIFKKSGIRTRAQLMSVLLHTTHP